MTKEEIRWLSIQKLAVSPGDTVYDIGAGTGSVAVEMARKAFDGFVYAIEPQEEACALIRQNAARHGAFNLDIVQGEAPAALAGLPVPDKAFIGGSSGNMDSILASLTARTPGITVVASAITLQTLHQAVAGFEKYGLTHTEIICVNIAKGRKAGGYDMMMAQNPVYIMTGRGGEEDV
jgi:precorrin-6Y C5,15-methyltransferase (decarboxylating)